MSWSLWIFSAIKFEIGLVVRADLHAWYFNTSQCNNPPYLYNLIMTLYPVQKTEEWRHSRGIMQFSQVLTCYSYSLWPNLCNLKWQCCRQPFPCWHPHYSPSPKWINLTYSAALSFCISLSREVQSFHSMFIRSYIVHRDKLIGNSISFFWFRLSPTALSRSETSKNQVRLAAPPRMRSVVLMMLPKLS
jgi:hypothetical protein